MAERKFYSYAYTLNGENGAKYLLTTGTLANPKYNEERKLFTCSMPVVNKTKTLERAFGCELQDNNGTVFITLQWWNKDAESMHKFFGDRTKIQNVFVCGRANLFQTKPKDGSEGKNIPQLDVLSWNKLPSSATSSEEPAVDELY